MHIFSKSYSKLYSNIHVAAYVEKPHLPSARRTDYYLINLTPVKTEIAELCPRLLSAENENNNNNIDCLRSF